MNKFLWALLFVANFQAKAQNDSIASVKEILEFQRKLNEEYKSEKESPLDSRSRRKFKGHSFFPIDLKYRVVATLEMTHGAPVFQMKTSTSRLPEYRVFGHVKFSIDGTEYKLPVYQSMALMQKEEYKDYLFFPFTDLTNDVTSYHGGRYLDLRIPKEGFQIVIDFNQAYNPYCAYSDKYSCPVVPQENQLPIEILAGVAFAHKN